MDEFNHNPNKDKNEKKYIKKGKEVLSKLVEKDGFYIILFICICILGTTAVWVVTRDKASVSDVEGSNNDGIGVTEDYHSEPSLLENYTSSPDFNDINQNADTSNEDYFAETQDDSEIEVANIENSTQTEDDHKSQSEQDTKPSSTEVDATQSFEQSRVISMILPTNGTITKEFAVNKLVYSKTLEQWTTHNGVDISTREGSVVRAALDGVVASTKKDHELGIVITLDHGDGLTTMYACLSTDEMVKVGQNIKKGETISGVGKGVGFELAQGSHLHFEVLIDGKNVDPCQYIPNKQ